MNEIKVHAMKYDTVYQMCNHNIFTKFNDKIGVESIDPCHVIIPVEVLEDLFRQLGGFQKISSMYDLQPDETGEIPDSAWDELYISNEKMLFGQSTYELTH